MLLEPGAVFRPLMPIHHARPVSINLENQCTSSRTADLPIDYSVNEDTLRKLNRRFNQVLDGIDTLQPRSRQEVEYRRIERLMEAVLERLSDEPDGGRRRASLYHPSFTIYEDQEQTHDLIRSQKSARQAVSADLPEFDRNPETPEWSHFEARFEETTELCGYSDGENVARLR